MSTKQKRVAKTRKTASLRNYTLSSDDSDFVSDMLQIASDAMLECAALVTARNKNSDIIARFERDSVRAIALADSIDARE
jgi:hypothetical protein